MRIPTTGPPSSSSVTRTDGGRFPILESMQSEIPAIPAAEHTPCVEALRAAQQPRSAFLEETVQQLRDEIAPSCLETSFPRPPAGDAARCPGSPKRSTNAAYFIPDEMWTQLFRQGVPRPCWRRLPQS